MMANVIRPTSAGAPRRRLLTIAEVADLVRLSVRTIRRAVAAGTFPAPVHVSEKRDAWRPEDVEAWMARGGVVKPRGTSDRR